MVLIYLNNGECIEVEDAFSVLRVNDQLLCFDQSSNVTMSFYAADVESYTANEVIADKFKEEVCEDLTVVNTSEGESELKA